MKTGLDLLHYPFERRLIWWNIQFDTATLKRHSDFYVWTAPLTMVGIRLSRIA